jgi:hypothetical protein
LVGALLVVLAACPRPQAPRGVAAADETIAIDGAIRGVAGAGALRFGASATSPTASTVHAYRGRDVAWRAELAGNAGPLAATDKLVGVTVARREGVRGDPAAAVDALDPTSGAKQWTVPVESTEWVIATSIAPFGDGFIVGGSFGGTLRVRDRVVTSAGGSDGFVARLGSNGNITWLVRLGGAGADGVQGVAVRGERIAIAGTFGAGAELGGTTLPPYDERMPFGDAFVAELDGNGAKRWAQTFGGRADDTVAGVAIDARGNVIVAGSVHDVVSVGSARLVTQGASDGILVWYGDGGEKGAAVLVGGLDFDGLRAIIAVGDTVIAAGFFSGALRLGDRPLTAGGGDDSFIAAFDVNGTVARSWHVGGEGREEVTSMAALDGGFVAGVAHTAKAAFEDAQLASPKDPMRGSALIVRGLP